MILTCTFGGPTLHLARSYLDILAQGLNSSSPDTAHTTPFSMSFLHNVFSAAKDAISTTTTTIIIDFDDTHNALASPLGYIVEKRKKASIANEMKDSNTSLTASAAAKDAIGATIGAVVKNFDERHDFLASPLGYALEEMGIEQDGNDATKTLDASNDAALSVDVAASGVGASGHPISDVNDVVLAAGFADAASECLNTGVNDAVPAASLVDAAPEPPISGLNDAVLAATSTLANSARPSSTIDDIVAPTISVVSASRHPVSDVNDVVLPASFAATPPSPPASDTNDTILLAILAVAAFAILLSFTNGSTVTIVSNTLEEQQRQELDKQKDELKNRDAEVATLQMKLDETQEELLELESCKKTAHGISLLHHLQQMNRDKAAIKAESLEQSPSVAQEMSTLNHYKRLRVERLAVKARILEPCPPTRRSQWAKAGKTRVESASRPCVETQTHINNNAELEEQLRERQFELKKTKESVDTKAKEVVSLETQLSRFQEAQQLKNEEMAALKTKLVQSKDAEHRKGEQLTSLENQLSDFRNANQIKEEEMAALKEQLLKSQSAQRAAETKATNAQDDLAKKKGELDMNAGKITEVRRVSNNAFIALASARECQGDGKRVGKIKETLARVEAENLSLRGQEMRLSDEINGLRNAQEKVMTENEQLRSDLTAQQQLHQRSPFIDGEDQTKTKELEMQISNLIVKYQQVDANEKAADAAYVSLKAEYHNKMQFDTRNPYADKEAKLAEEVDTWRQAFMQSETDKKKLHIRAHEFELLVKELESKVQKEIKGLQSSCETKQEEVTNLKNEIDNTDREHREVLAKMHGRLQEADRAARRGNEEIDNLRVRLEEANASSQERLLLLEDATKGKSQSNAQSIWDYLSPAKAILDDLVLMEGTKGPAVTELEGLFDANSMITTIEGVLGNDDQRTDWKEHEKEAGEAIVAKCVLDDFKYRTIQTQVQETNKHLSMLLQKIRNKQASHQANGKHHLPSLGRDEDGGGSAGTQNNNKCGGSPGSSNEGKGGDASSSDQVASPFSSTSSTPTASYSLSNGIRTSGPANHQVGPVGTVSQGDLLAAKYGPPGGQTSPSAPIPSHTESIDPALVDPGNGITPWGIPKPPKNAGAYDPITMLRSPGYNSGLMKKYSQGVSDVCSQALALDDTVD